MHPQGDGLKLDPKSERIMQQAAGVFHLLQPQPGERILDFGCGTGEVTALIAAAGAVPTGIDLSESGIEQAKRSFPQLSFCVEDASCYRTEDLYDAVFSHAALHWIKEAEAAATSVWLALRQGGRFVAEFAAKGNMDELLRVVRQEVEKRGYAWEGRNPWYHPTIGEYASLLERLGFRVISAEHLNSPKTMAGEPAIRKWLNGFGEYFFAGVSAEDREAIIQATEATLKPALFQDRQWHLVTSRLRVAALKE